MIPTLVGFDWDRGNREKCRKHGASIAVIERLFHTRSEYSPTRSTPSEERFKAIGRTGDGRAVLVVITLREHDGETLIRPISARYMRRKETDHYEKKLPKLETDEEAEEFVANADLTEYDLSKLRTVLFEFQPKTERVNMRLPKTLLDAVKESAAKAGVPYQRFIRQVLESAIRWSVGSQRR
jgi:predicted DNA binding CopG/RHH family protein